MSIFNIKRSPSSPEIQNLHEEINEIELRTYPEKLEQKNKKLLKEINNTDEEENETKNEHTNECEEAAGDVAPFDEREAEKKEIYKYILKAILSYTLLMLFIFSTFYIIYKLRSHGCGGALVDSYLEEHFHALNMTETSYETETMMIEEIYAECIFYLTAYFGHSSDIVTLHNLTFGLVSAVVVSQIGSHQQQQQQQSQQKNIAIKKLTNQLLHATESTPGSSRIMSRFVYNFITWTPQIYVVTWIVTGCACLLCGSIWGSEYSGPLFVTGQTWLGIAITTVYLFFGLQETAKENIDTTKEKDSVVDEHNDDDNNENDSGGGSLDANGNTHNDKNAELSSMSETNNTVTSSALFHTATSKQFAEANDDDDDADDDLFLAQV